MRAAATLFAIAALVVTTLGATQLASQDERAVCLPPAVQQALS